MRATNWLKKEEEKLANVKVNKNKIQLNFSASHERCEVPQLESDCLIMFAYIQKKRLQFSRKRFYLAQRHLKMTTIERFIAIILQCLGFVCIEATISRPYTHAPLLSIH